MGPKRMERLRACLRSRKFIDVPTQLPTVTVAVVTATTKAAIPHSGFPQADDAVGARCA